MTIASLPRPYSDVLALSLPADKDFLVESVVKHLDLPKPQSSFMRNVAPIQLKEPYKGISDTVNEIMSIEATLKVFQDE
jgi:hypothetical protein